MRHASATAAPAPPCLKYGSLIFVVIQNTALVIVGVHSRRVEGPQYLGSVAVLLTEVVKTAISLVFALADSGGGLFGEVREHVLRDTLWTLSFALPSLGYGLHNNLWYVAVTHLDPVTIAVMTQLKIVSAAMFSVLLLGRRLNLIRWTAIGLLVVGLAIVQRHSTHLGRHRVRHQHGAAGAPTERDEVRGLLAMVGLCVLSGLSGVIMERLLKDATRSSSLWIRNLQLAIFSLPIALVLVPLADADALAAHGPWVGLNWWVAAVVVLGACGGVMVSVVFKYADNILKSFAVGISIALSAAASCVAFGAAYTPRAALGMVMVGVATVLYHLEETRSGRAARADGGGGAESGRAPLLGESETACEIACEMREARGEVGAVPGAGTGAGAGAGVGADPAPKPRAPALAGIT